MVYTGLHHQLPQQADDLSPLLVFNNCLEQWRLHHATHADGRWVLSLERPIELTRYFKQAGQTVRSDVEVYADFPESAGIHTDVVRAPIMDHFYNQLLEEEPLDSLLFNQYLGHFSNDWWPHAQEFDLPNQPAVRIPANVRYGHLIFQVREALGSFPSAYFRHMHLSEPNQSRWATSLEDLGAPYGGLNPAAWVNPYTGAPMKNVPLSSPSPGDYSELPDPLGVIVFFHYHDETGGVSSTICGERGVYEHYTGNPMGVE